MGLFSAIASAVGSAVSAVCSAVGGAITSLGGAISAALTTNPVGLIIAAITLVVEIVKLIGAKEIEKEDLEDGRLGVMLEDTADTIKPENYNTTAEYITAVKENCNMDRVEERMENRTEVEKTAHQAVGVGLAGKLIAEKLGVKDDVDIGFLAKASILGLGAKTTGDLIKGLQSSGVSTAEFSQYFDHTLSGDDLKKVNGVIKSAMETIDPNLKTESQINGAINSMGDKIDAEYEAARTQAEDD